MAKSYYKYAEREADSYVNWGAIGKSLTDMLAEQNKIREDKKAALDKSSREFGEVLANAPQGENKPLNQWALEYGADAQEARLLQDKLFKAGKLKLKDYTIMRQNLNDGTQQAFNLVKEYQAEYSDKMKRYKEGKSQDLEVWLAAQAEGFGNFEKSKLYINPTDFRVSVAMKKKEIVDGKEVYVMDQDPNNYTTVNALRNRIKGTFDKYDVETRIGALVDGLGVEINSIEERVGGYSKTGLISEVLDITKRKNLPADAQGIVMQFEQAETKMLQAELENPYTTSSILTNTVGFAPNGKEYTYTWSEDDAKANPNKILLKNSESGNPVPEFSEEQKKVALERLRLEARLRYDKKQEYKATPQVQLQESRPLSGGEIEFKNMKDEARNFAQNLAFVTTGNPDEIIPALKYLGQKAGKLVDRTANGITVSNLDGTNKSTFSFTTAGKIADPVAFGKSLVGAFNVNLPEDMVVNFYRQFVGGKPLETQTTGKSFEEEAPEESPVDVFNRQVATDFSGASADTDITSQKDDTAFRNKLNQKLGPKYGVKFESTVFGNNIYIPAAKGRPESPEFPVGTEAQNKAAIKGLEDWIKKNYLKGATLEQKEADAKLALSGMGISTTMKGGRTR